MYIIKIILLLFVAFLFLPIKIEVYLDNKLFNIKIKFLNIKVLEKEHLFKKLEGNIEDFVYNTTVKILDAEENLFSIKDIKKIYKKLDIKSLSIYIGCKDPVITTYIFTFLNLIIAKEINKFENTKINMQMYYTENICDYKINCIFNVYVAENILEITKVIYKALKERWRNVWQSIQLKT